MKYVIAVIVGIVSIWYAYDSNVEVVTNQSEETASAQVNRINPLRNAPNLVSQESSRPIDFSELNQPYAPDTIDTEIAGKIRVDENGNLMIDDELKSYFDYFLSSVGQVTPEQAIRRLHLMFAKHLPPEAAQQAMETLEGYLGFKEAMFDLMAEPIDKERAGNDPQYRVDRLEYALTTLQDLRRDHMDPAAADAFFKEEEAYANYNLANQKIALDTSLTVEERRELRAQARANMPEDMAEIAERQETQAHKQQGLQQLIRDGASVDEISQYAYENFSPEEAQGITEHYQQEVQMKQQYAVYREQVEALKQQGLSEADLKQATDELAHQYFTEEQVTMVQAWDLALVH